MPYCGVAVALDVELQSPQRAPRPNKKFLIPLQPVLSVMIVATAMTEQMRMFILFSLICLASVFGNLNNETDQN
jgi:hypothetical protein